MNKTKRPLSFLLAVLMIVGMFAAVPFTASAEDKVIGENVIFKQGDTIVLPGSGIYYVKENERYPAREVSGNGTVTRLEGDEYSYTVEIGGWYIDARLNTFDYWEEMSQGMSVLGITFTGSGTESDPYLPKLAFGVIESTWAGEGEGTEASPWLIKDLNDLRTLSANVASGMTYSGKYLKLAADIDCGSDNWEAIGVNKPFQGTFDGDSHTITYRVSITENDAPKGLFAQIGSAGTVKNLNVAGSIVNTAEYAGPAGGIAAYNSGLIENCYSAVDITKGCDRGTGGIAAHNEEGGTIRYCAASGTLTWTDASDFYAYIGGITGENYNYNDDNDNKVLFVTNCAMLGDVLAQNAKDQYNYAGRLIGRQYDASTADECYYLDTMTVTGTVYSDSATAKTAEELKAIGQAAIDAGYTVYGLALGGSLSNPNVIKDCTYQYRNVFYANVPIINDDETFSTLPDGDIVVLPDYSNDSGIIVVDAKGYAYKFYDNTGAELPASMTNNETFSGSELGFSADVILYRKTFSITFTQAAQDSEVLYIVAAAPATDPDVENVIALIDAIGTVEYTDASKEKIDAARAAYDLLTAAQKELVTNYTTLTDAETAYANLEAAASTSNIIDLGTLTGNFEAQDGNILTGTLAGDYQITVADGATITLRNADITCLTRSAVFAGITLNGDATILLEGENTVRGGYEYNAGIFVPQNKTLTIDGTGSLEVSSKKAAAIGAERVSMPTGIPGGNIVINGGVINATGGQGGAGIGACAVANCGTITINGGTVTAKGQDGGPGIGSGNRQSYCAGITINAGTVTAEGDGGGAAIGCGCTIANRMGGNCGNITIANTVTMVTATKGASAPFSIGKGAYGNCGTVTIGGVERGNIATSPYVYPSYVVTWKNYDESVLETDECVLNDEIPTYDGETPAKAADAQYTYTFSGWTDGETTYSPDAIPTATGDVTYTATFTATEKTTLQDWQSVTIADEIYINFIPAVRDGLESVKIEYMDQGKVSQTIIYALNELAKYDETHYLIPVVVAPAQIGDTVKATLTVNGNTITRSSSISEYCKALIAGNYSENDKALAAATLEYGQAANNYFADTGYYTAQSFAGIEKAQAAVSAVANRASTLSLDENARGKIASASFLALTKPEFRFYTKNLTETEAVALNGKIHVDGPNGVAAKFVKNTATGAIMLAVTGIEAATMDQAVTISIDGFGTITFCGNDFARLLARNDATATLGAALYNYGAAAKACFVD